jgi:oxygen-independent coproporphyrinogen-3 oxidase
VGSAYTAVRDRARTRFLYRDRLWAGADLLSLGVASFGIINGTHYQNHHDAGPYQAQIAAGRLPVYRAFTPSAEERFVRELILQLKLGHVSRRYFAEKFGRDLKQRFGGELEQLEARGLATLDGDTVALTRGGLLQVDRLLHGFFLPEHQNARYS